MTTTKQAEQENFEAWAPASSVWSPWAKPVLFAWTSAAPDQSAVAPPAFDVSWAPSPWQESPEVTTGYREAPAQAERRVAAELTAIVLDLPGEEALRAALSLAAGGYRPVPLFNCCNGSAALVPVERILARLSEGAPGLAALELPPTAPPAFVLDADRLRGTPSPGVFDNRWRVFAQDFPSGNVLRSHGVRRALHVGRGSDVPEDLRHVLLAWKEQGLTLAQVDLTQTQPQLAALSVEKPRWFRSVRARFELLKGLRRNWAGGFGGIIPVPPPPSAGGHYSGGFS
jgi:hypothetical protein